jgi:hypothetical protein
VNAIRPTCFVQFGAAVSPKNSVAEKVKARVVTRWKVLRARYLPHRGHDYSGTLLERLESSYAGILLGDCITGRRASEEYALA